MNATMYEELHCRLMNFVHIQRKVFEHDLEFEDNECIKHLYYFCDHDSYEQFEEKFYDISSTSFKNHPQLLSMKTNIHLTPKQFFSPNTLFNGWAIKNVTLCILPISHSFFILMN